MFYTYAPVQGAAFKGFENMNVQYGSPEGQGPLLLTWFNFNPSMDN